MRHLIEKRDEILRQSGDPAVTRGLLISFWKGERATDVRKAFEHYLKIDPRTSRGKLK